VPVIPPLFVAGRLVLPVVAEGAVVVEAVDDAQYAVTYDAPAAPAVPLEPEEPTAMITLLDQLLFVVVFVETSVMRNLAAHKVIPCPGATPGDSCHVVGLVGAAPKSPVDHVYVSDPAGAAGAVEESHRYTWIYVD
jgi:hypothetical protein